MQVGFTNLDPCLNTVVVDVRPWALIVNHTTIEIFLQEGETPCSPSSQLELSTGSSSDTSSNMTTDASDNCWSIPNNGVFAPPKLDGTFRFGLLEEKSAYHSTLLQISKEDRWYSLKFEGRLPRKGSTNICIQTPMKSYCLTIVTNCVENIQILQLLPTFTVANNTFDKLTLRPMSIRKPSGAFAKPGSVNPERSYFFTIPAHKSSENLLENPILFWSRIESKKNTKQTNASTENNDHLRCVQFGVNETFGELLMVEEIDSDNPTDRRACFSVPCSEVSLGRGLPSCNRSYVVTIHQVDGRTKIIVQFDEQPQLLVYNNTMAPLILGMIYRGIYYL